MNHKFDELAKGLAQSVTRRQALKRFGVGLVGMALAFTGVARAGARPKTQGYCQLIPILAPTGDAETYIYDGVCIDPGTCNTAFAGCPAYGTVLAKDEGVQKNKDCFIEPRYFDTNAKCSF
jgi:hypothetical protein